jgi:NifU-like protein involved in Fe-S cluster formation
MKPTKEQQEKYKEHQDNPKNNFALENYNGKGIGKNPDNFGQVDMYMLVDKDAKIQNLGYEYKGCPTIAFTASVFSEELKGEYLNDALETTQEFLDEMDADINSDDCIKMILVALLSAGENYKNRQKGIDEDCTSNFIQITKT